VSLLSFRPSRVKRDFNVARGSRENAIIDNAVMDKYRARMSGFFPDFRKDYGFAEKQPRNSR